MFPRRPHTRSPTPRSQLQNAELATNAAPISSSLSTAGFAAEIFAHKIIYINGFTDPSPADLRALFLTHGGRVEPYLDRKAHGFVTHVVATNLTPAKVISLLFFTLSSASSAFPPSYIALHNIPDRPSSSYYRRAQTDEGVPAAQGRLAGLDS